MAKRRKQRTRTLRSAEEKRRIVQEVDAYIAAHQKATGEKTVPLAKIYKRLNVASSLVVEWRRDIAKGTLEFRSRFAKGASPESKTRPSDVPVNRRHEKPQSDDGQEAVSFVQKIVAQRDAYKAALEEVREELRAVMEGRAA